MFNVPGRHRFTRYLLCLSLTGPWCQVLEIVVLALLDLTFLI